MPYSPNPTDINDVLAYLKECQSQGFTPSTKEIADNFGKSEFAARHWLNKLQEQGDIERTTGKARRIRILEPSNG